MVIISRNRWLYAIAERVTGLSPSVPRAEKNKKLFIDCKLPREKRDTVLLLTDQISVLWIENIHFSERVKVGARSRNILELEIFKGKAA